VVDEAGAGLIINCSDCNAPVQVPQVTEQHTGLFDSFGKSILCRYEVSETRCVKCGLEFYVSWQLHGETVQCPHCRSDISVNRLGGQTGQTHGTETRSRPSQVPKPREVARKPNLIATKNAEKVLKNPAPARSHPVSSSRVSDGDGTIMLGIILGLLGMCFWPLIFVGVFFCIKGFIGKMRDLFGGKK